jgi:hypothetical protein
MPLLNEDGTIKGDLEALELFLRQLRELRFRNDSSGQFYQLYRDFETDIPAFHGFIRGLLYKL